MKIAEKPPARHSLLRGRREKVKPVSNETDGKVDIGSVDEINLSLEHCLPVDFVLSLLALIIKKVIEDWWIYLLIFGSCKKASCSCQFALVSAVKNVKILSLFVLFAFIFAFFIFLVAVVIEYSDRYVDGPVS